VWPIDEKWDARRFVRGGTGGPAGCRPSEVLPASGRVLLVCALPAGAVAGVVPGVLPGVAERILSSPDGEVRFERFDAMDGKPRAIPNISDAKEFLHSLDLHPAVGAGRRVEHIRRRSPGVATDRVDGSLLGRASGNG
jgi:hypothetical protein